MIATETDLWQRIAAHEIGPTDVALSFVPRLARENRWSIAYAERVVGEYRRFCYLAVTVGHEVTPPDAVDQAWHLHLTYSRDYWLAFCPQVLRTELHHGPTRGGAVERSRFYHQYAQTLADYEVAFAQAPPNDIWPDAHRRFAIDPGAVRINFYDGIFLQRRVALALVITAFMVGWLAGRIM